MTALYGLADFQTEAKEAIVDVVRQLSWKIPREETARAASGRTRGAILLQSPTGSGKTLVLGRSMEALCGEVYGKMVWFWFAPFSGLVAQTREALAVQCPGLRLRDVYKDRSAKSARDGDVFIQTWASVAARNAESRKVRREDDIAISLDAMLEELRAASFNIGVVIDEAHLNFGGNAKAASDFFKNVLKPDFTILATATPKDQKLSEFQDGSNIIPESRIVIDREAVVDAGLNKVGLMMGYLKFREIDAPLIDAEQAILAIGWRQHVRIRQELDERSISLVPLMLVQVEDQVKGGEDPVLRVREKLHKCGVPDSCIRSHTSGEPDPEFHTLAYDPDVQVLIFKVAVATGFDAPRAWTLVSIRPNRGRDFGLQIVGRIMRVHPLYRPLHKTVPLLDRGYVFLADPAQQEGLSQAADTLEAVKQSIEKVTDTLDVWSPLGDNEAHDEFAKPSEPTTALERADRMAALIKSGIVSEAVSNLLPAQQDLFAERAGQGLIATFKPMFTSEHLVLLERHRRAAKIVQHRLRKELGIPDAFWREEMPDYHEIEADYVAAIANEFCRSDMFAHLTRVNRKATLERQDVFTHETERDFVQVRMSDQRVAEAAEPMLNFEAFDSRTLKNAIRSRMMRLMEKEGHDTSDETAIQRAIDLTFYEQPDRLKDAVKRVMSQFVRVTPCPPIPEIIDKWTSGLPTARKGAFGVFPPNLNNEERAYAEFLDEDESDTVLWWIKCDRENWAAKLVLPDGKTFCPDFAVGVRGRRTKDHVALVEIKDDGETGRLHSNLNRQKIEASHPEYKRVFWNYRIDGREWIRAESRHGLIGSSGRFEIEDLVNVF